ncbi:MAG TPA: hypothetical protein VFT73_04960, partial [Sphingomonas sp.]|nr:hypothetical protein [Sphingomonas sp.]
MTPRERREVERIAALLKRIPSHEERFVRRFLKGLRTPVQRTIFEQWRWQSHEGQFEPRGDWRLWVIM